jgi:hypothetical protein
MNYFIKRDLNEYGPYSLADLQKYVASGNILLTDLCRSEGLTDWVPVSQVIGNIPVPAAPAQPAAGTVYGGGAGAAAYGTQAGYAAPVAPQYPPPPSLHWGIVLLLAVLTCGLFLWVWAIVQALWLKKVAPQSKTLLLYSIAIGLLVLSVVAGVSGATMQRSSPLAALLEIAGAIVFLVGAFKMRDALEEHYNSAEPIGLSLSGVMTFFFAVYYFQYHFNRINEMKQRQMGYPG